MVENNQALGQIFQMPPKKHHPKMIALIVVICACVAVIVYAIYFQIYLSARPAPVRSRTLTEQQKLDILNKLSAGKTNTMTEKQKLSVLQSLSSKSSQSAAASLSEQDKLNILQSLKK